MYVCPCIIYEIDERYPLMQQFIYYYKQLYLFRASICPSSGVLGCILIILLHMVSSTIRYKTYTSAQDYTPAPQNLSHNT